MKTQGRGGSSPDQDKISFVFLLFCHYYSIYDHLVLATKQPEQAMGFIAQVSRVCMVWSDLCVYVQENFHTFLCSILFLLLISRYLYLWVTKMCTMQVMVLFNRRICRVTVLSTFGDPRANNLARGKPSSGFCLLRLILPFASFYDSTIAVVSFPLIICSWVSKEAVFRSLLSLLLIEGRSFNIFFHMWLPIV